MKTPAEVETLELECTCMGIGINRWNELMNGDTRADSRKINRLVKIHLPDLYEYLSLNMYNPYFYHKTRTHLILVHSGIEYFLKYN